jgi:predicted dinucleotide-binding enzyme
LGETLGRLLVKAGYQLAISNSTWQETLEFVESIEGSDSSIVTSEDAIRFGEVCCNTMEQQT